MFYKIIMTILRSISAYVILLILARLMGRKLISKITFFDFLIGVALGSLAVRIALEEHSTFILGLISAVTITLLVFITDLLNLKSYTFRKLEEGEPILLIDKGNIVDKNLKKAKISLNKLTMLLREKNVFNVDDAAYVLFENDGEISLLLKSSSQNIKASDLNVTNKNLNLPIDLIIDGKILNDNLKKNDYNVEWLKKQLSSLNIQSSQDVFYCCINSDDSIYVSLKNHT